MPFEGYRKVIENDRTKQKYVELKLIHHYQLFQYLRKHEVFDFWFASGEGAKVLVTSDVQAGGMLRNNQATAAH